MQNDAGEFVDLYVPRKCSASNRIIGAKDHASIQMNVAEVSREDLCAGEGARSAGLVCVLTSEPRAWS